MRTIELNGTGGSKVGYTEDRLVAIIESWTVIKETGKHQLTARQSNFYDGDDNPRYLVNFQAATSYGMEQAMKFAKKAVETTDVKKAAELWQKALNSQLTGTVFTDRETGEPRGYLPESGEDVNVIIGTFPATDEKGNSVMAIGVKANSIFELKVIASTSAKGMLSGLLKSEEDKEFSDVKTDAEKLESK
jgi:hypothetical protein